MLPDLSRQTLLGIDTETTGLTHGDRPVGLSLAAPNGAKLYVRWGHQGGGNNCTLAEARTWAARELAGKQLVFFNAVFDLRMLRAAGFCLRPSRIDDAGVMAAMLDEYEPSFSLGALGLKHLGRSKSDVELNEKCARLFGGRATRQAQAKHYWQAPGDWVAAYAEDDAELTLQLYQRFAPRLLAEDLLAPYEIEMRVAWTLVKMYEAGVRVNLDAAQQLRAKMLKEAEVLRRQVQRIAGGRDFNFQNKTQLVALFTKLKITIPETEKGNPSITKETLETIDHPVGMQIRRGRRLVHYADTFIESYILNNVGTGDTIHPNFHQAKSERGGTVTGRLSSAGGLNAQNIPKRDEEFAPLIRGLFIPMRRGDVWLRSDYSQIEYRFLAHYAGGGIKQAYIADPDVDFHQGVAELTGIPRTPAKTINFGLVYGMGEELLAASLRLPLAEAREILQTYHQRVPEVKHIYNRAMNLAAMRGYITTWGNRRARFRKFGKRVTETHKSLNKLLQGSAADLIKRAMADVGEAIDWEETPLHLTVHDELDFSMPAGSPFATRLKEMMEDYQLEVPVKAEVETGPDWGHGHVLYA